MKKAVLLVACVVLLPTILGLAWFVGLVLEFEYPYFFQIRQAQTATTPDGVSAQALLARSFPVTWSSCLPAIASFLSGAVSAMAKPS